MLRADNHDLATTSTDTDLHSGTELEPEFFLRRGEVWIADYGEDEDRIFKINIRDFLNNPPDSLSSANATIFEGYYNGPASLTVRDAEDATVYIADTNDGEVERLTYNSSTGNYTRAAPVSLSGPSLVRVVDIGL